MVGRRGSEETGRTRKTSRYAGTGASTFAPACTHKQAALLTSYAASYCDLHEPGLAHELV